MRKRIRILTGDKVRVEVTPYDLIQAALLTESGKLQAQAVYSLQDGRQSPGRVLLSVPSTAHKHLQRLNRYLVVHLLAILYPIPDKRG